MGEKNTISCLCYIQAWRAASDTLGGKIKNRAGIVSPNTNFNIIYIKKEGVHVKSCVIAVTGYEPKSSPGWYYRGNVYATQSPRLYETGTRVLMCLTLNFRTDSIGVCFTGATVIPPLDNHSRVHNHSQVPHLAIC